MPTAVILYLCRLVVAILVIDEIPGFYPSFFL